jgi:hypothetical protein
MKPRWRYDSKSNAWYRRAAGRLQVWMAPGWIINTYVGRS